jgi:tetratricopeptide (TPR) repeat protein
MHRVCPALLVLLFILPAARADDWPVVRGASREPVPYRYAPGALVGVPRDFLDDSVATIVYAGSNYLVEPDGTVEIVTHEVTRLNGRKGVEKLGEFRGIAYTPSYQKLTLNEARIHKRKGGIVAVEARHVHFRDVATDYQVYDPEKQLIISFPGLEVGDTIEVKWTVRGKNPEHGGQFFNRYAFGDPQYPVILDELRVRLPRDRTLKYACVNGTLTPQITEPDGTRLYHWKKANCPRPPRDENLPSREELRLTVLVSTFTSWEQVGQWKHKLREACWKCTPEVRKVVEEVTKERSTPTEKARALTYWVRRNIRYVSAGDKHDYTPHAPDKVLGNRFGDCKDTTQLLAVMLREAGIKVELVTLGTLDDGQIHPDVPSPWGTHAVLLASIADREHWIDTTATLAGWDFLPRDDLDRLCYLTDDKGKLRLKRTPTAAPERNKIEQLTHVWIGQDGTSRCRRTISAHGSSAMGARDSYVEVPPGERRRQLTAELQDANSRTRLLSLRVDDRALADFDLPVVLHMEFEIPRHFTGTTEREGSVTDSKVWGRLLAYNIDHDRKTPMVLPAVFESKHTYRFHAPTVLNFESVPRDKLVRSKWGTFRLTARALDDGDAIRHLEVVFHTRLEKTRIEVEDLEAFRKFHEEVNREYRVWLTLRPVADVTSAPRLEELLHVAPQNAYAARTLAKIYLKANRLADAARVLDRACHYSPDEFDLWELRVDAAESSAGRESAYRDLIKHHPKKVGHQLGLASALISQSKHDEARALLEPLTKSEIASTKALAHYQLARSHYRKDALKEALTNLDLAARADASTVDTVRVHVLRGQVLDELKRPHDAIAAYRKALELDRGNQEVLWSLIRLCLQTRDEQAVLGYLQRYAQRAGRDVSGLLLAAETYYQLKRYDEALDLALRAREINFHEKGQRILGLIYLHRKEYARARNHLARAEQDRVVVAGLLQATIALGKPRELDALIERGERLDSTGPLGQLVERARAIVRRRAMLAKTVPIPAGKEEETANALDALVCAEGLAQNPQTRSQVDTLLDQVRRSGIELGPVHALKARLSLQSGKLREALREANEAIRQAAEDPAGYHMRGRILLEQNASAIDDLEKAARLSAQQDVEILVTLAEALFEQGKVDRAIPVMRSAVKLLPKDEELKVKLRKMETIDRKKAD